jgi:hypothetical protein
MKLTIQYSALRAAQHAAAVKDVRFYLCGVHVHFSQHRDGENLMAQFTGTDGHIMFTGASPYSFGDNEGDAQTAAWSMIIPHTAIPKKAPKCGTLTLASLPDGRYMLGDTVFAPVDGRFPDYARVTPDAAAFAAHPAAIGQYDPDLLARAKLALHTFYGTSKGAFYLHQRGPRESAIMAGHDERACVVIMPMRLAENGNAPVFSLTRAAFYKPE